MRQFDSQIVQYLNGKLDGEPIHYIGLGLFDFQVSFGSIRSIQGEEEVRFFINNTQYTWKEGPCDIPVWLLAGQIPVKFELQSPLVLRINLASGDYIDFVTSESPYESVVIRPTPTTPDECVLEVF